MIKVAVTRHAIDRSFERLQIGDRQSIRNFLIRRVRRAVEQKSLSSVAPGWTTGHGKPERDLLWIDTFTEQRIAILLTNPEPNLYRVITVLTPE